MFFVEIGAGHRTLADFPSSFAGLRGKLASAGFSLDEIWVGETRLYLKVRSLVTEATARAVGLATLRAEPLIAKVVSSASAPTELRDLHRVEKLDGRAVITDAKLRGLREKRRGFKPDLVAPNMGEIIVKYLEAEADTPAKASAGSGVNLSNDDWQTFGGSALNTRITQAGNPPLDSRESMIVARLSPGLYNIGLTGKNGATGVALLEVHEY